MYTEQLTQALAFAGTPTHAQQLSGNVNSASLDLSKFRRAIFLLEIGALGGTSPTVDAKLQESTDNASWSDLAGSNVAMTQVTAGNKLITFEVRPDQLSSGKRYVRLAVTLGGTSPTAYACIIPVGSEAVEKPASAANVAAVAQQLVVA
jgi:hypothetical protein